MTDNTHSLLEPWKTELRRGLVCLRGGQYGQARYHFERAHRLGPDSPETCFALGREYLRDERTDEAEVLLRRAWLGDRSLASAAAYLSRCLGLHLHSPEKAQIILDQAYEIHGRISTLLVVDAEIALDAGDLQRARHLCEEALEICDDGLSKDASEAILARVIQSQGIELADSGQVEAALFCFRRATRLDPAWSAPHCNLGAAWERLGQGERARPAYELALELDPENTTARLNLARFLRNKGRTAEALQLLSSVADPPPLEE